MLLAIVVLALAFRAPDRSHSQLMPKVTLMRVAMIELGEYPESRQFQILGANRRTNELNRLRESLDTRDDAALAVPTVAHLPANRSDSGPEHNDYETDLNLQSPAAPAADVSAPPSVQAPIATLDQKQPVGIQEEKPAVATLEEKAAVVILEEKPAIEKLVAIREGKSTVATPARKPTVIQTPRRVKSRIESRAKVVRHMRNRAQVPAKQEASSPQYFFEPFGSQQTGQTSAINHTNYFGNQQARQALTPSSNNYFGAQRAGQTQSPNSSNY
jgi:hypothetical protein